MDPIACPHVDVVASRRVCLHLLANPVEHYLQRFTGDGLDYDLTCRLCANEPGTIEAHLRAVCVSCFERIEREGWWVNVLGTPHVRERASTLAFAHERVATATPVPALLAIEPVNGVHDPVFIALTRESELIRIDLAARTATSLATLRGLDLARLVALHIDRDGRMAALANRRNFDHQAVADAIVVDLASGRIVRRLAHGSEDSEHTEFPLAFTHFNGRLLLVHATDWNRLDVSDPASGEVLTARVAPASGQDHYRDYFYGSLWVSPNEEWIVDTGWVWHPVGMPTSWNLNAWLTSSVWESEDGATRRELAQQFDWDLPCCWIDDHTVALSGYQSSEQPAIAAVRLYDVADGRLVRWFPGPEGQLAFDEYLFSSSEEGGTAVWDIETGERLLRDEALRPVCYHHGARALLSLLPDGSLQLSRLRNGGKATGDEDA